MTVVAYVLGAVALVMIILTVSVVSFMAGKRQAVQEMLGIISSTIEPLKSVIENAPKTENAPNEEK